MHGISARPMAEVLIFPLGTQATESEAEELAIGDLERAYEQFVAAADEAERLEIECRHPWGKALHRQVAAYFRRHANRCLAELEQAVALNGN